MSHYQFTPQAVDDLFEIWSYVARDNVKAASRLEDAVYEACAFPAVLPAQRKNAAIGSLTPT